jgi:hypothetical protein
MAPSSANMYADLLQHDLCAFTRSYAGGGVVRH